MKKGIPLLMTPTALSPFLVLALALNAAGFSGEKRKNPGHDTLMKMNVDAPNKKLIGTVRNSGSVCPKGVKTYFQGFDSNVEAY